MKNLCFRLLISSLFLAAFSFPILAQNTQPVTISVNVDAQKTIQKLFGKKNAPQQPAAQPAAQPAPTTQPQTTPLAQPQTAPTAQPAPQPDAQPAPVSSPATNVTADKSFGGEWKMTVTVSESLSSDGQRQAAKGTHEIGLLLKIEGARFTGDYNWAKGVCAIAHVEGTMTGANTFDAVVEYGGSCCGGSKMKLTGNFTSLTAFSAKFKPEGRPGAWCTTWWATIQGVKE
jgi:hypothetical protein